MFKIIEQTKNIQPFLTNQRKQKAEEDAFIHASNLIFCSSFFFSPTTLRLLAQTVVNKCGFPLKNKKQPQAKQVSFNICFLSRIHFKPKENFKAHMWNLCSCLDLRFEVT